MGRLDSKKVAFLATDGVEQVELTEPWKKVEEEGGTPELVSLVVLPGGVANPDFLRMDENAVSLVRSFFEAGIRDRKLTSWPSLRTDITNAGGNWVDEEVVVDNGLVSSRNPDDLPAFCDKLAEEICEGKHAGQTAGVAR